MITSVKLSIVIVTFNTWELLRICLNSLLASEDWSIDGANLKQANGGLVAEVIAVDNASADGTPSLLRSEFPWVRLVANGENAGFARANNQGIGLASGQYVFLLNPDTEIIPGAICAAVEFMEEHLEAGALGFQLLNPDRSLQPSGRDFPRLVTVWRDLLPLPGGLRSATRSLMEQRDYSQICEVDEVSGAAVLLRRRALDQVGFLDEDFFFLGEDVDLCWRLREQAWKVYYLPMAKIIHHWGGSRAKSSSETISLLAQRSLYLLFKKHRSGAAASVVKVSLVPVTLAKMLKWVVFALAKGDISALRDRPASFFREMSWLWRN